MKAGPILLVKGISKRFGGITALDDCSLEVERGAITALIGPNGSGKTTLFDVISGLLDEDEGSVFFDKEDISIHGALSAYKVARSGISRTFQDVRLFSNLTIREHLKLALAQHDTSLMRNLIGIKEPVDEEKMRDILALLRLDKPLDTVVSDLSYGQRKLLDLAMAVLKPHTLLMLDEPVAGVNPKVRAIIKEALVKLVRERKETILLIEHDMLFTMELAKTVYVLDAGHVLTKGTPDAVRKDKRVLEAYLGA